MEIYPLFIDTNSFFPIRNFHQVESLADNVADWGMLYLRN